MLLLKRTKPYIYMVFGAASLCSVIVPIAFRQTASTLINIASRWVGVPIINLTATSVLVIVVSILGLLVAALGAKNAYQK
jgi:hypothetical protein